MDDSILAARRELHELTVLSSALLRLATKVQSRCDALRHTLGDLEPIGEDEVDSLAPRGVVAPVGAGDAPQGDDHDDPAALLALSLAGEGMSREQISAYLQESFQMDDTRELLDRVLPHQA